MDKRRKYMKKFLTSCACLMMILVGGIALSACQTTQTNSYITVSDGASFSGSEVEFKNADNFKLEYKGNNHYVATGSASTMTAEQATTWGTVEGSKFIVVKVKMGKEGNAIIGWRSAETADKQFEDEEIDGSLIKRSTSKNETKNYILAISDGDEARHPELTTWRIEVTEKDATESVAYTIDFSALYA